MASHPEPPKTDESDSTQALEKIPGDLVPQPLAVEAVYTYLDDTMRSVTRFETPPTIDSPWLLYGKPEVSVFYAKRELMSLPVMSKLGSHRDLIPVQLGPATANRIRELYYQVVNYFAQQSAIHNEYCFRTPAGFKACLNGSESEILEVAHTLDGQFSSLIRQCSANTLQMPAIFPKEWVDTVLIPSWIEAGWLADKMYYTAGKKQALQKAYRGNIMHYVGYMLANHMSRSVIVQEVSMIYESLLKDEGLFLSFHQALNQCLLPETEPFISRIQNLVLRMSEHDHLFVSRKNKDLINEDSDVFLNSSGSRNPNQRGQNRSQGQNNRSNFKSQKMPGRNNDYTASSRKRPQSSPNPNKKSRFDNTTVKPEFTDT